MKPTILNPNSSGQGESPLVATHPLKPIAEAAGYTYSHSTPINFSGGGGWYVHHTFKNAAGHNVGFRSDEFSDVHWERWDTSTGKGTGRATHGVGGESLKEHLKRKRRRYAFP